RLLAGFAALHQVIQPLVDGSAAVDAGAVQGDHAGGGAGEAGVAHLVGLVAEATFVQVLAALDILHAAADVFGRHGEAGVPRRPQCHDLADRHRDIGVVALRAVAPAA